MIRIALASKDEAEKLHDIFLLSWSAFHERYNETYKSETLSSTVYRIVAYDYYTIYEDNEIIGGVEIRRESHDHYRLHRMFIHPNYQNKGLGSQVVKEVEKLYPEVKEWSTDTPVFAKSNQAFYQKLGYEKVREIKEQNVLLIEYKKMMEV